AGRSTGRGPGKFPPGAHPPVVDQRRGEPGPGVGAPRLRKNFARPRRLLGRPPSDFKTAALRVFLDRRTPYRVATRVNLERQVSFARFDSYGLSPLAFFSCTTGWCL